MCIVEIEGRPNTPTACTTLVEDGMIVQTDSPEVHALRRELFKLLLSEHPCELPVLPGAKSLRRMHGHAAKSRCHDRLPLLSRRWTVRAAGHGGIDLKLAEVGYPVRYRMLPVEKKDPFFDRDYNLCVLCERCVRACEENHFSSVLTLTSRGTDTVVGTPLDALILQAGCSFCGACLEVCPTGRCRKRPANGSGVPEREVSTTCPLCSAGCQISLLVKNDMVIGSLPDHASGTDILCVKGRFGITEMVNHPTRLEQPRR